jgi:23S rRNA pseudouridine1911/1915/1917 synthase
MDRIRRSAVVPAQFAGERVDRAAARLFDEFSRAVLARWIDDGALTVDGREVRPKTRLAGAETLTLDAQMPPGENWTAAEPVPFHVLYEDEHVLVVDKPAGVVVHPGAGNLRGTLVNGLLAYRGELAALPRAGIVHRLDKDTSGAMLVAGSLQARTVLVRALAAREISRQYLAVTEGALAGGMDIDRPIGRDPSRRTRQAIRDDGRAARTQVRVVERYRAHSLVRAVLETGRTHQIRVHLASIGHPLVGDRRYGARGRLPPCPSPALVDVLRGFTRQALHAASLGFSHPVTGQALVIDAPMPEDLDELLRALAADVQSHRQDVDRAIP